MIEHSRKFVKIFFYHLLGDMTIYENIKEIADRKGLTIKDIETKAGLSNGSIGSWRESSPTVVNLSKVAKVLKVSINRLVR